MKFLKVIWMGIWRVVFGIKRVFAGKDRDTTRNTKLVLKGHHAQMLAAARKGSVEAQIQLATC
jgi:hypothetical protein